LEVGCIVGERLLALGPIAGNWRAVFKRRWSILSVGLLLSAVPASGAAAAPVAHRSRPPAKPLGVISQLSGPNGCLVDRSSRRRGCTSVRALLGPGPFVGSEAIAVSPDGRNVYAASSSSNAIAVFRRAPSTGKLTQASGPAGCIAARGKDGCGSGVGLAGPNSVAVSADGKNVYATSLKSSSIAIFQRNPSTGALTQRTDGTGCLAAAAIPSCTMARALDGADVVAVSHDGHNVYVGAFIGSTAAVFARSPFNGTLVQLFGSGGCISQGGTGGCATGLGLSNPEGLAVSGDGKSVYVAAPGSNALDVLARDPLTGALTQATGGGGCFVNSPLTGCTVGRQLGGADAVAVSSDDRSVYVAASLTNSVANFTRTPSTGLLAQSSGTTGCAIYVLAVACTLGRTLTVPEGLAVSPDGANVYAASFLPGSIDVFDRTASTAALMEKPRRPGCVSESQFGCTHASPTRGASSAVVSPDGKNVYVTAFASNALDVFKRQTKR
jgi:DNA-binding beta-propeller fold protein YncE